MNERYRRAYEELFNAYPRRIFTPFGGGRHPVFAEYARFVHEAIEEVDLEGIRSSGRKLRADAKALLLVNMAEMIVRPLVEGGAVQQPQILEGVEHDIKLLVAEASVSPELEVTGHSIIDSLNRNWRRLLTAKWSLWTE